MLTAGEQVLDHRIAPRKAIVRRDVIGRRVGSAHASKLTAHPAGARRQPLCTVPPFGKQQNERHRLPDQR